MVGALLAVALAGLFGASMAELARMELTVAGNGDRLQAGLAAVDECAARVLRALPLGWEFADALAGPDGVAGTADDGLLVAPPACRADAQALGSPAPRILVDLDATRAGGRRLASMIVGRAADAGPASARLDRQRGGRRRRRRPAAPRRRG
jgi:hypothetical protein